MASSPSGIEGNQQLWNVPCRAWYVSTSRGRPSPYAGRRSTDPPGFLIRASARSTVPPAGPLTIDRCQGVVSRVPRVRRERASKHIMVQSVMAPSAQRGDASLGLHQLLSMNLTTAMMVFPQACNSRCGGRFLVSVRRDFIPVPVGRIAASPTPFAGEGQSSEVSRSGKPDPVDTRSARAGMSARHGLISGCAVMIPENGYIDGNVIFKSIDYPAQPRLFRKT